MKSQGKITYCLLMVFVFILSIQSLGQTGGLTIETVPSGAKIVINGTTRGITPQKLNLEAGTYTVKLEKKGYQTKIVSFIIEANDDRIERYDLEPDKVEVRLSVKGSSADIYIDGVDNKVGTATWKGQLAPGEHTFITRKEGCTDEIKDVVIVPGHDTTFVLQAPTVRLGTLKVTSNVSGYNITIIDQLSKRESYYVPQDDWAKELPIGDYQVVWNKQSYSEQTKTAHVKWNEITTLSFKENPKLNSHVLEFGGWLAVNTKTDTISAGGSMTYAYVPRRFGGYVTLGYGYDKMVLAGGVLRLSSLSEHRTKRSDWHLYLGGGYDWKMDKMVVNYGARVGWHPEKGYEKRIFCPYSIRFGLIRGENVAGIDLGMSWRIGLIGTLAIGTFVLLDYVAD